MKKNNKEKDDYINKISGGIGRDNLASTPTILYADDFIFEPISCVIDVNGDEYVPSFIDNSWVWRPKNEIESFFKSKEYKTEILGWVKEMESGDEIEES